MALRNAEVFHSPFRSPGATPLESTYVQKPIDRSLDTLPTLTPLGENSTWVVESKEERDLIELKHGIASYVQKGGHLVSGDVYVRNAAFWQVVHLAEDSGETLTPDEIHSYIRKRSAASESPLKSDRAIFEEVIIEREDSQPVLILEPAA
jgi:hypothetical protein